MIFFSIYISNAFSRKIVRFSECRLSCLLLLTNRLDGKRLPIVAPGVLGDAHCKERPHSKNSVGVMGSRFKGQLDIRYEYPYLQIDQNIKPLQHQECFSSAIYY